MPFYDFCGFWSVAVNNVYKLQFFTCIFAVLLPVLSRLLIMFINTTFLIFQDGGCPPSKIFKCSKYQLLIWRTIHYYVHTYAKISVIRKFCDFSYVLFAISLQKLSYLGLVRTYSPRWSYSIYRTRTSIGDWACSLSSVFGFSVYL